MKEVVAEVVTVVEKLGLSEVMVAKAWNKRGMQVRRMKNSIGGGGTMKSSRLDSVGSRIELDAKLLRSSLVSVLFPTLRTL